MREGFAVDIGTDARLMEIKIWPPQRRVENYLVIVLVAVIAVKLGTSFNNFSGSTRPCLTNHTIYFQNVTVGAGSRKFVACTVKAKDNFPSLAPGNWKSVSLLDGPLEVCDTVWSHLHGLKELMARSLERRRCGGDSVPIGIKAFLEQAKKGL